MIKFFRKIRQNLLTENKTGKYFKYAIGEIALVVIGILIALQINNWNEEKKLESERKELISELLIDFNKTNEHLNSSSKFLNEISIKMNLFFTDIYKEKKELPLDSIQSLVFSFVNSSDFSANLTTYNNASSSGKLSLIQNKQLQYLFSDFFDSYNIYKKINEIDYNNFFTGTFWELKKEIGSLTILFNHKEYEKTHHKKITYNDYLDLLNSKLVFITLENRKTSVSNLIYSINNMLEINEKIITELNNSL